MNDEIVNVNIWGRNAGALYWDKGRGLATFEYDSRFRREGWDVSPLRMPLDKTTAPVTFPANRDARCFHGLPGLVADSLPDDFGNQLIDEWFVGKGYDRKTVTPLDRLCYVGKRGMGALEFEPDRRIEGLDKSTVLYISELTDFANEILRDRERFHDHLLKDDRRILDILKVGTSAGGAKPKAIIAYNDTTGEVRSGQVKAPDGYTYWLLKFDGTGYLEHGETGVNQSGTGNIEFAYYKMAVSCGINMMESRLLHEGDLHHFMTKRFDRTASGDKLHVQTAAALAHLDRDKRHSYEELFLILRTMNLPYDDWDQLFRRMVFNIMAKNHDDHTKNFSFVMDRSGTWRLSPAYDVCYAYSPGGEWTGSHQLSANGKTDHFCNDDLLSVARNTGIRNAARIIEEIKECVSRWPRFADEAGVFPEHRDLIDKNLLYNI